MTTPLPTALADAIKAMEAIIQDHQNLEDSAPTNAFCGDCNMGAGPHREYCLYHAAVYFKKIDPQFLKLAHSLIMLKKEIEDENHIFPVELHDGVNDAINNLAYLRSQAGGGGELHEDGRRKGHSKLHGRPLDEDGGIEFTPPNLSLSASLEDLIIPIKLVGEWREAVEQAIDCVSGEAPEDCSPEEARQDTLSKLREADQMLNASLAYAPSPASGSIKGYSEEWCMKAAKLEGDCDPTTGLPDTTPPVPSPASGMRSALPEGMLARMCRAYERPKAGAQCLDAQERQDTKAALKVLEEHGYALVKINSGDKE